MRDLTLSNYMRGTLQSLKAFLKSPILANKYFLNASLHYFVHLRGASGRSRSNRHKNILYLQLQNCDFVEDILAILKKNHHLVSMKITHTRREIQTGERLHNPQIMTSCPSGLENMGLAEKPKGGILIMTFLYSTCNCKDTFSTVLFWVLSRKQSKIPKGSSIAH